MRTCLFLFILLSSLQAVSQGSEKKKTSRSQDLEKYISMNFFAAAEPQFALGPSFGIRYTERSEFFAEAAYVTRTPFYDNNKLTRLNGARFIIQYRYHFLQQWRPLFPFLGDRRNLRARQQPFIGLEWRMKPLSFSSKGTFINSTTADTLSGYSFRANSFTYGGALIFGETLNLSADEKWKLEITAGIGAKNRLVKLKSVPPGYSVYDPPPAEWFRIPAPETEAGGILFPFAIRLRYVID